MIFVALLESPRWLVQEFGQDVLSVAVTRESMKGSEQLDLSPRHKPSSCRESVYSLPDACLPARPKLLQLLLLLQGHLLSSLLPHIHVK